MASRTRRRKFYGGMNNVGSQTAYANASHGGRRRRRRGTRRRR